MTTCAYIHSNDYLANYSSGRHTQSRMLYAQRCSRFLVSYLPCALVSRRLFSTHELQLRNTDLASPKLGQTSAPVRALMLPRARHDKSDRDLRFAMQHLKSSSSMARKSLTFYKTDLISPPHPAVLAARKSSGQRDACCLTRNSVKSIATPPASGSLGLRRGPHSACTLACLQSLPTSRASNKFLPSTPCTFTATITSRCHPTLEPLCLWEQTAAAALGSQQTQPQLFCLLTGNHLAAWYPIQDGHHPKQALCWGSQQGRLRLQMVDI